MVEIELVIAIVMAIGGWLKGQDWYPNSFIPLAIVLLAVAFNLGNAFLFHGDTVSVGIQRGSVRESVPGCEAVNLIYPAVIEWLKKFM
ncbi:hypothetical protein [uncultured Brevibacillus sp.]|uniref:hypothetical protein n=1 Tax=uncultured Brevibacillus sp. TaxID=169970 RepID=UPI002599C78B|nr:hypothetical protein [uncultured Brevibacillus sp.]